jgi:hypothetical protein
MPTLSGQKSVDAHKSDEKKKNTISMNVRMMQSHTSLDSYKRKCLKKKQRRNDPNGGTLCEDKSGRYCIVVQQTY